MIYLSICIPTFNRSGFLKKTLESIVTQDSFLQEQVEIVISDNASTDDTESMVKDFQKRYKNITYIRNTENIGINKNIFYSLSNGKGLFKKISNDTYIYKEKCIDFLVGIIKDNLDEKPLLLFSNRTNEDYPEIEKFSDLNKLLENVTYYITSDIYHGYWNEDIEKLRKRDISKWFWTITYLCDEFKLKRKAVLVNKKIVSFVQKVPKKNVTYGVVDVFYNELFKIYAESVKTGILTQKTFEFLEKDMLFSYLPRYILENKNTYTFSKTENIRKSIEEIYEKKSYYPDFLVFLKLERKEKKIGDIKRFVKKVAHSILNFIQKNN